MHENSALPDNPPCVTILMPVYNGQNFIRESIDSILNQTMQDWEFLIIDDASTDGTPVILEEYAYRDNRFTMVRNRENMGITRTLNRGLRLSRGKYVVRMDADDRSLPERIEKQVCFMDNHPEIGVSGTWIRTFGYNEGQLWRYPTQPNEIRCHLLFYSALAHPTAIMRKSFLDASGIIYSERYKTAQDYDFWLRCSEKTSLANIGEALVQLRQHPHKIGTVYSDDQTYSSTSIRREQLLKLGFDLSEPELSLHNALARKEYRCEKEYVRNVKAWLDKLHNTNKISAIYPEPEFSRMLAKKWFNVCSQATPLGLWTYRQYRSSHLVKHLNEGSRDHAEMLFRALLQRGGTASRPS